jgi:hypothetical protein
MAVELRTASAMRNKRSEPRWRTRLQSGKIFDSHNRFLTDCQVHDRSTHGARLRVVVNAALPSRLRFFDEVAKQLFEVQVAWQRGQDIGAKFVGQIHVTEAQSAVLASKSGHAGG